MTVSLNGCLCDFLASFDVRLAALRKTSLFEFDRALSFSSFD